MPLERLIDRYRITYDRDSGIVNDPNGWFDDPSDLISSIRRIVQVSVETMGIVERLPEPLDAEVGSLALAVWNSPSIAANCGNWNTWWGFSKATLN